MAQQIVDGRPSEREWADLSRRAHRLAREAARQAPVRPRVAAPCATIAGVERREHIRFRRCVEDALAAIAAGALDKVVIARARELESILCGPAGHVEGFDIDSAAQLGALRESAPSAIAFAWRRHARAAWLGASPEVLARVNNGWLTTAALAGTAVRGQGEGAAALLGSTKMRREHALVVDAMADVLGPLTRQLRVAAAPRVASAERLLHLETEMSGELAAGVDVLTIAERLHPTPALGGSPRSAALAWLREHEHFDRGLFGGPIGWVAHNGDGVIAVAIRSAIVSDRKARLFAGAGIVAGSDPEEEWCETENKLAVVARTLRSRGSKSLAGEAQP
jgi:isochorismate synthase